MASSAVEICNWALSHVKAEGSIEDLDPTLGEEERQCERFYDVLRRQALTGYDWAFATETEALALTAHTPDDTRWQYAYQYPVNCLRFMRIVTPLDDPIAFKIMRDETEGRVVLTSQASAVGEYVIDITDPAEFDDDFALALSWWIAAHIAIPLTGKESRRRSAIDMFNALSPAARVKDANEAHEPLDEDASWIAAR